MPHKHNADRRHYIPKMSFKVHQPAQEDLHAVDQGIADPIRGDMVLRQTCHRTARVVPLRAAWSRTPTKAISFR
jgi:hypothetical protein